MGEYIVGIYGYVPGGGGGRGDSCHFQLYHCIKLDNCTVAICNYIQAICMVDFFLLPHAMRIGTVVECLLGPSSRIILDLVNFI